MKQNFGYDTVTINWLECCICYLIVQSLLLVTTKKKMILIENENINWRRVYRIFRGMWGGVRFFFPPWACLTPSRILNCIIHILKGELKRDFSSRVMKILLDNCHFVRVLPPPPLNMRLIPWHYWKEDTRDITSHRYKICQIVFGGWHNGRMVEGAKLPANR